MNSGVQATHTYSSPGSYVARLRVTDNDGASSSSSLTITATAPQPITPVLSVSVGELLDTFEENEVAAQMTYMNKVIAVTGYVETVQIDYAGRPFVLLARAPDLITLRNVYCYFPTSRQASLAPLREGDHITITGRCDDYSLMCVWMEDCTL